MAHYIWFYISILTLPTNLAQIIPFLKRKFPAPFALYVSSLITNIGIACLIAIKDAIDDDNTIEKYVFIVVGSLIYATGVFTSFVDCFCWCCDDTSESLYAVDDELESRTNNNEEFIKKIAENRSFPPQILVFGEAYHFVENIKIITYSICYQLEYITWQEDGNPIEIPENEFIHGFVESSFVFDDEAIDAINFMRQSAYNDVKNKDTFYIIYNKLIIPGLNDELNGTISTKKNSCVISWIDSPKGKLLIGFLKFILTVRWAELGFSSNFVIVENEEI